MRGMAALCDGANGAYDLIQWGSVRLQVAWTRLEYLPISYG